MRVVLFALFSISLKANAEKYALFIGGGGEQTETVYTYQQGSINMVKAFQQGGYKTRLVYNGKSQAALAEFKKMGVEQIDPFERRQYDRAIEEYMEMIKSGKISANDQIFVSLMSHGEPQNSEHTHSLATNKLIDGDSEKVSLDKLKALADLAATKGIKLAIADGSCYSGPTLKLKNQTTCIVSSSADDGPSVFSHFPDGPPFLAHLVNQLKPG